MKRSRARSQKPASNRTEVRDAVRSARDRLGGDPTIRLQMQQEASVEFHRGRLIDHIQLRCADLEASKRFYGAVLAIFGRALVELAPWLIVADELCLTPAGGDPPSRIHIALQTENREEVDRFYAA